MADAELEKMLCASSARAKLECLCDLLPCSERLLIVNCHQV